MKITADTSIQQTAAASKPTLVQQLQKAATTETRSGSGDVVSISDQARKLETGQADSNPALAGTPRAALAVPNAAAGEPAKSTEKAVGDEQEKRAPERATAQRQQSAQATQGRINLLA